MKTVSILFCAAVCAFGQQNPQAVNQSDGPPSGLAMQTVFVYSGSNVVGICYSQSVASSANAGGMAPRPRTAQIAISAISKASAAIVTSTGHGLTISTNPSVTISGATGTGWVTGINGSFVATVIDANTFSVPVASTGFGTLAGTVVFTTTAPRQTVAEWAVQIIGYSGANAVYKAWLGGSQAFGAKCSDATNAAANFQ